MKLIVTGEPSATAYKRLVQVLKPMNKKQLWAVLDHYLFHVIRDEHIEELLRHLKEFEEQGVDITADVQEDAPVEDKPADFWGAHLTGQRRKKSYRPKFSSAGLEAPVLAANKDRLDLMFDMAYFENYLTEDQRADAAKKLLAFCEQEGIPAQVHWREYAAGVEEL